jgi:hypothetical protein
MTITDQKKVNCRMQASKEFKTRKDLHADILAAIAMEQCRKTRTLSWAGCTVDKYVHSHEECKQASDNHLHALSKLRDLFRASYA